ncbi:unnamed protein product, partial [marine sediment metagenome]
QIDPEKLLARIDYLEENRAVYPKCSRNGAIVR